MSFEDADQAKGGLAIFRKLIGRVLLCPRGKHRRSRRRVRKSGSQYVSRCHYCGTPMVRIAKRQWIVDERRK